MPRGLTHRTTTTMNNQQRYPRQRRHEQRAYPGRDEAQTRTEPTLDQYAGAVARDLIKQADVEDSTPIWKALKRAYLAGYADAQR